LCDPGNAGGQAHVALRLERGAPCRDARYVEQAVGEPREPEDLPLQELGPLAGRLRLLRPWVPTQHGELQPERVERRAQLVRGHGDERVASADGLRELAVDLAQRRAPALQILDGLLPLGYRGGQ